MIETRKNKDIKTADATVGCIGCFADLDHLKNIYIGKGVRKIEHCALDRDMRFHLNKIYIPPTVTELEGEIFDAYGFDCWRSNKLVIGAPEGSTVQACCCAQRAWVYPLEEQEITDFMATPLPDTDEDTYLLHCTGGVLVDEPDESAPAVICDGELHF